MGIDLRAKACEELPHLLGSEHPVQLHHKVRRGREQAEVEEREVLLPVIEFASTAVAAPAPIRPRGWVGGASAMVYHGDMLSTPACYFGGYQLHKLGPGRLARERSPERGVMPSMLAG